MHRLICVAALLLMVTFAAFGQNLNDDLLAATRKSDIEKVKTLLDKGADVNAKSPYGATPLFFACDRSNTEMVKLLLERGAEVNIKDTFYGASPLIWVLGKNNPEIVRMLVEKGAKETDAALEFGVGGNHAGVVKAALARGGIEQKALDKALRAANAKGNKEIGDMLKAAGAVEAPEFKVAPEALKIYEGTFKNENVTLVFKIKDGKLIGTSNGNDSTLAPVSPHVFELVEVNGYLVTFKLEGEKVTGLALKTPGPEFTLKKEEPK